MAIPDASGTVSRSLGRKRPARQLGLLSTNAAFLVPDFIRKKFMDGWTVHVPLTYLTDSYCAFSNHSSAKALQDSFSFDAASGNVISNPKPLPSDGELKMTFDEWHQAWR